MFKIFYYLDESISIFTLFSLKRCGVWSPSYYIVSDYSHKFLDCCPKISKKVVFLTVYLKLPAASCRESSQESDDSHVDKVCMSQFLKRFNLLRE